MATKITAITQGGKRLYLLIRSDPDAALQLRQLILALCICLAAAFAAQSFLVQPRLTKLEKKLAHVEGLHTASTDTENILLSARLYTLQQELAHEKQAIAILTLQERLLREQWQHQGNDVRFHKVMYTLDANAPLTMQANILKMSQGETRSDQGFNLYPIHLEGRCYFPDFYRYLHYLEESTEIGYIDDLEITARPSQTVAQRAEVNFKLTLGRLEISHDL